MAIALTEEIKALLDGPNYAHLATLMPDGSPHAAPVWVAREGDRVLLGIRSDSIKGKNARRDPRVALSIVDVRDPYRMAQLRGRAVEFRGDPEMAAKDAMSRKYVGKPFPWRYGGGVVLVIEVERARFQKVPLEHAPAP
jgi:PPOX class probable F420-dependent enzyme